MDEESRLRLERDEPDVREFLEQMGGDLERLDTDAPGTYWVTLQPRDSDRQPFVALVTWTVYPGRPPSVAFRARTGDQGTDARAWPAASGYRAPNDICKPFTAEGHAAHPEWAATVHRWNDTGNPFLFVVENLQDDIDRVQGARAA